MKIYIELKDINGKVLKDTALEIYNKIHPHSRITKPQLTKQLVLYGIKPERKKESGDKDNERRQYYAWI